LIQPSRITVFNTQNKQNLVSVRGFKW